MTPTPFVPARSKLEAVARLYAAAQAPAEPLGPGSKEKKSVLIRTADRLSLPVDTTTPKDILARQILQALHAPWDPAYASTGQTITLSGLNAILSAVQAELGRRAARELRRSGPTLPDWFAPARDKLEAVRRISSITGGRPQDLGPGSKERKSVLTDLVQNLGLPIDPALRKDELAGRIARHLGMPWTTTCRSSGQTVTLDGLNAVLAGAEQRALRGHAAVGDRLRQEAELLVAALAQSCPRRWEGRSCVEEMLTAEYSRARQTEWVGWYFEFVGLPALVNAYGGGPAGSARPSSTTRAPSSGTSRPTRRKGWPYPTTSSGRPRSTTATRSSGAPGSRSRSASSCSRAPLCRTPTAPSTRGTGGCAARPGSAAPGPGRSRRPSAR